MTAVAGVIPVLPVPLVATALLQATAPLAMLELKARCEELLERLEKSGAHLYVPRGDRDYAIEVGLRSVRLRHLVVERDGLYAIEPGEQELLRYYANSIAHLLTP
jgi:glycerol-3-phosphate O-acyltransferase